MNKILLALILTAAFGASARGTSRSTLDRGFNCSMAYQETGKSVVGVHHKVIWQGDGASFTDDYLKVHTVTIKKIQKNVGEVPSIYWRLEVSDEDSSVFLVETPDFKGFDFTVPVDVLAPDSEDPPTYKSLRIACDPAHFAG